MAPSDPAQTPQRTRVRRGNREDAHRLRGELLAAASTLYLQGGIDAVSMRAVAAQVGVSPMTTYRYFADKNELVSGLWKGVIDALCNHLTHELARVRGARARHRRWIDASLRFWEQRPDDYSLIYGFTSATRARSEKSTLPQDPVWAGLIAQGQELTFELALEIGAPTDRVPLASQIRLIMQNGYLHSTLVVTRVPWAPTAQLRAAYLAQIEQAVERYLLDGAD